MCPLQILLLYFRALWPFQTSVPFNVIVVSWVPLQTLAALGKNSGPAVPPAGHLQHSFCETWSMKTVISFLERASCLAAIRSQWLQYLKFLYAVGSSFILVLGSVRQPDTLADYLWHAKDISYKPVVWIKPGRIPRKYFSNMIGYSNQIWEQL